MILSLGAATVHSTTVDNKASPPEINTSSNHSCIVLVATIIDIAPAPPITWGYNNVYEIEEDAANIAHVGTLKFFLGPGDSFVSGRLAGQQYLSQNNSYSENFTPNMTGTIKPFLGPGDSPELGEVAELNNMRHFASDDNAINQPMEIGGHRIV